MSSLEHTATAPAGATTSPALDTGTLLDHYVIERELGSGGMGVVYAAFDTELQRRVALKVLRDGLTDQAQQRLLREARAMARLTHPNVVTVYEVGSANARDFVAMELVDGESLAEWLRAERRREHEILDAFISAGRGLAAAHGAGMVHRDFKPHNVLRSKGGRVVVTDFGLARDAADPLTATLPVPPTSGPPPTDSALSDLTVPGSLVGTPAYMAPEQWSGGRLTPATDQFAFCVALWEALSGERPYRGITLEALREQVTAGPDALDASKLPHRFRRLLRRGLAADPRARWPSMDALLSRLQRRTRRIAIAATAGAALVAIGTVVVLSRSTTQSKITCRPPAIAIPTNRNTLEYHQARSTACEAPKAVRESQLACLDRVAARLDAVARAQVMVPTLDTGALSIDPDRCGLAEPLALPARYSDEAVAALALSVDAHVPPDFVDRVRAAAPTDHCVAAYLAISDGRYDDATRELATCGDDLAAADLALRRFESEAAALPEADLAKRTREVERILEHASRRDLDWRIEAATAAAARQHRRFDDALAAFDAAIAHVPNEQRRLELVVSKLDTLLERGRRLDVELVREQAAKWRPIAERLQREVVLEQLSWLDATAQWTLGDVAGGGKRLRELHAKKPPYMPGATRLTGVVVDRSGKPLAGATVASGFAVAGDAASVVTPLHGAGGAFRMVDVTTTDDQGRFVLEHGPACYGAIVAEHRGERSVVLEARDGARLVVQPTTHVRGRVDIAGRVGMFSVSITHAKRSFLGTANVMAMVGPDGRFSIDGVIPGDVIIGLADGARSMTGHGAMKRLHVPPRGLEDVVLEVPVGRELRVLVRGNDMIAMTPIFVVDGAVEAKTLVELVHRVGQHQMATAATNPVPTVLPPELVGHAKPGDLLATFTSAPTGRASACAMRSMGGGCDSPMQVVCAPVPANTVLTTIEVNKR
ncbi:MAG: protein kinase [Myxococcota bacterium]|nr:protein kinase [Myxococcota bacterium]